MRIGALGLVALMGGHEGLAQRNPGCAHPRRNPHGRGSHFYRSLNLPARKRDEAHAHQRLRVARVFEQHLLIAERYLTQPASELLRRVCRCRLCCHPLGSVGTKARANRAGAQSVQSP